jgi:1-acyl-sn-glycerol-3-phosphate acyltransferase
MDLWQPAEGNAAFDESWDPEKSPNLQDTRLEQRLAEHERSLVVTGVDADEFGGAAVSFGQGFVLRLFPAGTRSEDWRLFRPKTDAAHFVARGGRIERGA